MTLTPEQKELIADWAHEHYALPFDRDEYHSVDMDANPIINPMDDKAWVQIWVLVPYAAAGVKVEQKTAS